jgi:hypothetical protein
VVVQYRANEVMCYAGREKVGREQELLNIWGALPTLILHLLSLTPFGYAEADRCTYEDP